MERKHGDIIKQMMHININLKRSLFMSSALLKIGFIFADKCCTCTCLFLRNQTEKMMHCNLALTFRSCRVLLRLIQIDD